MEKIPKPKHGSIEWLKMRHRDENGRVLFGASDAPALMGASPYKTRADLFVNKLHEPEVSEDKPEFRRGNILEPVLLQEASEFFSRDIFTPDIVYRNGRFSVSLDGVDDADNPSVIVEAKTTTRYSIETGSDLPAEWLWQGWCQQGVLSPDPLNPIPVWFAVLDKYQRFSVVPMPDNRIAYRQLKDEAETLASWIEAGEPSPDDINDFTAEQIAAVFAVNGQSLELTEEQVDLVFALEAARLRKKQADDEESELKKRVAQMLLNYEIGTWGGKKVVSWKQQKGRKGVNITLLRNENPELVAHYETEGTPFRVMRTHKIGEE